MVGLGWAGLGWAGLGWAGLGWAGLGLVGRRVWLDSVRFGSVSSGRVSSCVFVFWTIAIQNVLVKLKSDVTISSDRSVAKSHSLNHGRRAAAFFSSLTSFKTLLLTSAAFLISSSEKLLPSRKVYSKPFTAESREAPDVMISTKVLLELAPCRVRV